MATGEQVVLGRGFGYAAMPIEPRGGVLVVHDRFGLHPHVERLCDELAGEGFMALAANLFDRSPTIDPAEAERLMRDLPDHRAESLMERSAEFLRVRGATSLGAVGFAMGGRLALLQAHALGLDAVVAYYAALEEHEYRPVPAVLLHLADVDGWDPPDQPDRFARWVQERGGQADVRSYRGTEHSFANPDAGGAYDEHSAVRAKGETIAFLASRVGPSGGPQGGPGPRRSVS